MVLMKKVDFESGVFNTKSAKLTRVNAAKLLG